MAGRRLVEAITRIAREAVEDAAADGVDHLEVRFGPASHAGGEIAGGGGDLRLDDVIAAVCAGLAEGRAATGIVSGAVVAALRHHDPEVNEAVARAAARFAGRGVVGFDLAGDELLYPAHEPHARAFGIAAAAGLGLTCHAAEAAPATAVRDAVRRLGATRIGHGAHLVEDRDELAWAADHGIVVEVCPTSNWYTGAIASVAEHPALRFLRAGLGPVLGDDNPRQTRSPLSAERRVLADVLGFGPADLAAVDAASLDAAFLDPGDRAVLRARAADRPG